MSNIFQFHKPVLDVLDDEDVISILYVIVYKAYYLYLSSREILREIP